MQLIVTFRIKYTESATALSPLEWIIEADAKDHETIRKTLSEDERFSGVNIFYPPEEFIIEKVEEFDE